jgi:rod shape-determining protein MreC
MYSLLRFLIEKRNFLFFVLLEVLCGYLIVSFNHYQGALYFNSANTTVGSVLAFNREVVSYFDLRLQNDKLAFENAKLKKTLTQYEALRRIDSMPITFTDSLRMKGFEFIPARVIKNSIRETHNYISIDKGLLDSIGPNLGIVSTEGVVGELKYVSNHYATGYTLLHINNKISAKLAASNAVGTLIWDGADPRYAKLTYIGRHYSVQPGDKVVTTGYDKIFPPNIEIGVVEKVLDESQSFYNIVVKYSTDFATLDHVYIIKNLHRAEQDTLESKLNIQHEPK